MAFIGNNSDGLVNDAHNKQNHKQPENKNFIKNVSHSIELLDLNDHCLLNIFEFLLIFDQMRVQKVCRRFEQLIKLLWQQKKKKIGFDRDLLYNCRENKCDAELYEYLQLNSIRVENLKLDNIHGQQLELIKPLRFPNVKTLDINLWLDEYPSDKYTSQLIDMFPAVENLTLQSCITGMYLWKFKHVSDLNIDCCEFLDTIYFEQIFKTLKLRRLSILFYGYNTNFEESVKSITLCNMLEELRIDDHHLLHLIDYLNNMPKLRRLVFYTRDYDVYLMQKITDAYGEIVQKVVYNDVFWAKGEHLESLLKMTNLERLILFEDDFEHAQIEEVANKLTNLREFRFVGTRMSANIDDGILSVVENCLKLEILDVSKTAVSTEFLQRLNTMIQKQKNRIVPLKFYCYETLVAKDFISDNQYELCFQNQLTVSLKEQEYDTLGNRFIDCVWLPTA